MSELRPSTGNKLDTVLNGQHELDWGRLLEEALTLEGSISEVYNRFANYSFGNQILLLLQGVNEPVNTLKRWNLMGRRIKKGSSAKTIMVPLRYKRENEKGEQEQYIRGFKFAKCLFGVSETEGAELPEVDIPEWSLDQALGNLAITKVPFEHLDGNCQGFSVDRTYAINPVAGSPTKTTFHEISHIVLGHTAPDEHEEYMAHRGVKEFQAEGAAYLTMNELGQIDDKTASESRGYLQSWLRGERPADLAIRQVFGATDKILRAGREAPATKGEQT